ncbi:MAG: FAD-dependent tricarballylate dehydrogenase TcuA, partial [Gammaproteobacteria bacterium]|nr:FAD-dependent tricarballylate dehydrogenase TcuA [Gammaproteobacteria bacterium]
IHYGTEAQSLEIGNGRFQSASVECDGDLLGIEAQALVVASGGFQANTDWLKEVWGDKAENFLVRGTPYAQGRMLKELLRNGMKTVGSADQCHAVAIDARAPKFDGGIVSRLDSVPFGIVVNNQAQRFYDEGEDFWPKRYAIWGRLVAEQPDQIAYSIIDSKSIDRFMPSVFPAIEADSIEQLAQQVSLDEAGLLSTINRFNEAIVAGHFDQNVLDECHTSGLEPPKSHWALAIDTPPFYAYPLRPGITFTYLGVAVNQDARVVQESGEPCENVFAAGEIMAGNILGQGYCAGTGMTIGGVFGRIAGERAACLI